MSPFFVRANRSIARLVQAVSSVPLISGSVNTVARGCFFDEKPDLSFLGLRRGHQLSDRSKQSLDIGIMGGEFSFQLDQLDHDLFLKCDGVTKPNECSDHEYAHTHGVRAVEHIGRHDRAVLSEDIRQIFDIRTAFQDHRL